jgi:hypothetical protein
MTYPIFTNNKLDNIVKEACWGEWRDTRLSADGAIKGGLGRTRRSKVKVRWISAEMYIRPIYAMTFTDSTFVHSDSKLAATLLICLEVIIMPRKKK